MKNGCILCGGVGSGKSITSIAYFFTKYGSGLKPSDCPNIDIYIITTALKRDTFEWDDELINFGLSQTGPNKNDISVTIDSWNNIKKYSEVKHAFFIFDEQKVSGYGAWTKSFLKIAKCNDWILLSATPGDKWIDYAPVFIANGFYRNITEFRERHVIYKSCMNIHGIIDRYWDTQRLERLRDAILIDMPFDRGTVAHHIDIITNYNFMEYKMLMKERFDYENNKPFDNASSLAQALRKLTCNDSKMNALLDILNEHSKVILFYNFDYELYSIIEFLDTIKYPYSEWNGHKHQDIPSEDKWVYLVNYNAGSEGWNCTLTDTMIFFSNNYSYRIMVQAAGRIDRLNTPFSDLYYYHMKTRCPIDKAIDRALANKKKFNESRYFIKILSK